MEILARAGLAGLVLALKATAVLAAGFLAIRALPRASASARHLAALLVLAGAALVPLLSPLVPRWEWRVLPPAVAAVPRTPEGPVARTARVVGAEEPKIFSEGEESERPREERGNVARAPGPAPLSKTPARSAGSAVPLMYGGDLLAAAALAWALGAAAMLARVAAGLLSVRGLVRRARPLDDAEWSATSDEVRRKLGLGRPVALLVSRETEIPLAAGVLRPVLVLPPAAASWDAERRRVVLLHELAHVRRRDTLARVAAETALALYWFHPLAHAAVRTLRREGERAADDLVLSAGTRPSDYAAHLVAIVRGLARDPERWAVAMARPSQVEERVLAILDPALRRIPPGALQARVASIALVAGAAALAALHLGVARPVQAASFPTGEPNAFASFETAAAGRTVSRTVVLASKRTLLAAPRESGSEWYSRGMRNHERARYDDAIAAFQKAIALGYREGASSYNIACGYALKGDRDRAFAWLGKAAAAGFDVAGYLDDDDLDALHGDARWKTVKRDARAARLDAKKGEGDRAAARLEQLVGAGAKDGPALYRAGMDLLKAGRYDLAEKAFRASAAAGNRPSDSIYNAACALARGGKKAEALDALEKAIEEGYGDGRHMENDDDLESLHGEKRFTELLDLTEDLSLGAGVEGFLGNFLPRARRTAWRGEVPRYEKVAKAHPEIGRAWFNLGYAQLMADRPEAAAESFGKALERGYRKPTTLYNLACSEARAGNADKAFDRLFKAIEAGFDAAEQMEDDTDLDSIRRDPRFKRALRLARDRKAPDADDDDDAED